MTTLTFGTAEVYIPPWTTSTNLGPLPTTAFPTDCLASLWDFNTPGLGMPWTQMTQGCAAKTCCPNGNVYTEAWAWMTSYYSPGVCPSQYRSCPGPLPPSALSTVPGETIAFCCPTNYNCPESTVTGEFYFQYCQSGLSTATTVIVVDNIFDQKTLSTSTWSLESGFQYSWQAVYPIQVRNGGVESTSAPAVISATMTSGSASPTATPTSPPTSSGSKQSVLSPGGVIGLSVSIGCSVITMLFGIGWKVWKYRKEKKEKERERQAGAGASGVLDRNTKHLGNG